MISSQRIPPITILYIFIGAIPKIVSWEGGRVNEESIDIE